MPGHEVTLDRERETKNTIRFKERERDDGLTVVGTLYLTKWAVRQMGDPQIIRLTVAAE